MAPTSPQPDRTSRSFDLLLSLFDRQVLDPDDTPVGKVDDIELTVGEDGSLMLTAVLLGPDALTPRYGEPLSRWSHAVWARLREPETGPARVELRDLMRLDSALHVAPQASAIGNDGFERWMRRHVISKIPGSRVEPEG